ncbi:MAG: hypothetical protein ACFNWT_01455 [Prevotella denticola]
MKHITRQLSLILGITVLMASCTDRKKELQRLAEENLRQSVEYPKQLQVLAISEPDSAFGFSYFSQKEKVSIVRIMKSVTDSIMKRTNNMQSLDITDFYVMDLAERQMRANSDIRQMLSQATDKKEWTGWKVKIDYQAVTHHGMKYNAERWFFISRDSKAVVRTFELPLP